MTTQDFAAAPDVIDHVAGITPQSALFATRHTREKVVQATQGSYDLFFGPHAGGLPLQERLLVAYHACLLSKADTLARHYHEALVQQNTSTRILDAVSSSKIAELDSNRLKALLVFTQKLIERPVDGDKAALQALQAAGVSTPDIVTLAQLIAFLSYQLRLTAGLQAMKALESRA